MQELRRVRSGIQSENVSMGVWNCGVCGCSLNAGWTDDDA